MNKPNKAAIVYDSLNEWLEHADQYSDKTGRGASHREDDYTNQWAGGTFAECLNLARNGWPEGYDAIKQATQAIFQRVAMRLPVQETQWHEVPTAGCLDIGRLMEGDPNAWIEQVTTEEVSSGPSNKTCRIVANITTSCTVSTHTVFTRGAAIVALGEALELLGRSVEITIGQCVAGYGEGMPKVSEVRCTVKPFHSRANWPLLSFCLAHPGMQRRLVFASQETFPQDVRRAFGFHTSEGYGRPTDGFTDTGDLYLPAATGWDKQWQNAEVAEQWVLEELQRQGVVLRAD